MNAEKENGINLKEKKDRWDIFREVKSFCGGGRCCSVDEFSVVEGGHGQSGLCWAERRRLKVGELSGCFIRDSILV